MFIRTEPPLLSPLAVVLAFTPPLILILPFPKTAIVFSPVVAAVAPFAVRVMVEAALFPRLPIPVAEVLPSVEPSQIKPLCPLVEEAENVALPVSALNTVPVVLIWILPPVPAPGALALILMVPFVASEKNRPPLLEP